MANEYAVNQADLKAVADAIREKSGTSDALEFPGGFVDAVGAIQAGSGGGDDALLFSIVDRTITDLNTDIITVIGTGAFRGANALKTVNLPNLESVTGTDAFNGCASLTSVKLPKLTKLGDFMFPACRALNDFDFSNVLNLGRQTFSSTGFTEVTIPKATSMGATLFSGCGSLEKAEFGASIGLNASCFSSCSNLKVIILRSNTVCSVATNSLSGTPFASGGTGGTVYVPEALIESYQNATNWSALYAAGTCNFVAIEGSEYE